ncbi:MAG TPA: cell division protein FtsZ, partial [Thiotrichales bacterium]|nr:cell division protein FtsZ [Thiotrichales bacterium]
MSHRGMALMGVGEASGEDAAIEAMKDAIESPLFDNMTINGAMGILVHFHISPNCPLSQISEAMNIVHDSVDEEADVIFGTT